MKIKNIFCSLSNVSIILIMLLFLADGIRSQNEIEELENNFLTKNKNKINDNYEAKDNQEKSSVILEINEIQSLKKYFAENKKFIFEVYSSTCPHCIKLAPELEKLAVMYKGKVKFLKTDGRDSYAYRTIVKVDHFPSLYIYENGSLTELGGSLNYNTVKKYIDEKYFFNCEKIKSLESLKAKLAQLANKRFFIGVLDEANLKNSFEIFWKLMSENMLIVENCFYFANNNNNNNNNYKDSNNDKNEKNSNSNSNNNNKNFLSFYSSFKNFILINNSEKINVYEDIDFLLMHPSFQPQKQTTSLEENENNKKTKSDFTVAVNSLSKSARNYFFDNSFASVFNFTKAQINLIFQNPKLRAVFSFDKSSKEALLGFLRMFVAQRKNIENYNLILFDLENAKEFDDEEKMYLYFTRVPGVHFTNQNFENIFHFNLDSLDITKINEFADDNYAKFKIMLDSQNNNSLAQSSDYTAEQYVKNKNDNNVKAEESKENNWKSNNGKSNAANVSGFGVEKKFVTAKIVEKLDKVNYDKKGNVIELQAEYHRKSAYNNVIGESHFNSVDGIVNYDKNINHEKNKLADDFVNGKKKNKDEELSKKIGSVLVNDDVKLVNNISDGYGNNTEDPKKHENGINKIKILVIYFIVYSAIYYFFYLRISKRDESKYN